MDSPASSDTKPIVKKARASNKRPPPQDGAIILDKSCKRCRVRKVFCTRVFPCCANCTERGEECDLATMAIKTKPKKTLESKAELERQAEAEVQRIIRLEQRLAHLESLQPAEYHVPTVPDFPYPPASSSSFNFDESIPTPVAIARRLSAHIGHSSIDARLSRPQMERSLSQHLCEAFLDSCCSHLPAFNWFHSRLPDFRGDLSRLSGSDKVSIASFSAIGARASPHSSLLGISSSPSDAIAHPLSPLLNAGTRRESACRVLLDQAHFLFHENGLADQATPDNLAACLALMQMAIFVEVVPIKSRSLVRVALGHYKELQDLAVNDQARASIKKCFALSLYSGDSITSSYARKRGLISPTDLQDYFNHCGIILPNFEKDNLLGILEKLLDFNARALGDRQIRIKTSVHAVGCFTWACMRLFSTISAPPIHSTLELTVILPGLWKAIDHTIASINLMKSKLSTPSSPSPDPHSSHSHDHSNDYLTMIGRFERDLLDLNHMIHVLLEERFKESNLQIGEGSFQIDDMFRISNSRIRKGLRSLAGYAKEYISARDKHLTFHLIFQMELLPDWTSIALQRFDPGLISNSRETIFDGPEYKEDEVTFQELQWFIEGLQHACYYMPAAEKKLAELMNHRFETLDPIARLMKLGGDHVSNGSHTFKTVSPTESFDDLLSLTTSQTFVQSDLEEDLFPIETPSSTVSKNRVVD